MELFQEKLQEPQSNVNGETTVTQPVNKTRGKEWVMSSFIDGSGRVRLVETQSEPGILNNVFLITPDDSTESMALVVVQLASGDCRRFPYFFRFGITYPY